MPSGPYAADASLSAKVRRRVARLMHRRPARLALTRPTVSFTFDDAPASSMVAADILETHAARGTWYLCAGLFDQPGHMGRFMNAAEAHDLHARGHEIAAHTWGHIDCHRTSDADLLADDDRNARGLIGLAKDRAHFAFPYGEVSPRTKRLLAARHGSMRGVHPGLVRDGSDLNLLPSVGVMGARGETTAGKWIHHAVQASAWVILFTHDVSASPSPWGCTPDAIARLAAQAIDAGCDIRSVSQVLDR